MFFPITSDELLFTSYVLFVSRDGNINLFGMDWDEILNKHIKRMKPEP